MSLKDTYIVHSSKVSKDDNTMLYLENKPGDEYLGKFGIAGPDWAITVRGQAEPEDLVEMLAGKTPRIHNERFDRGMNYPSRNVPKTIMEIREHNPGRDVEFYENEQNNSMYGPYTTFDTKEIQIEIQGIVPIDEIVKQLENSSDKTVLGMTTFASSAVRDVDHDKFAPIAEAMAETLNILDEKFERARTKERDRGIDR